MVGQAKNKVYVKSSRRLLAVKRCFLLATISIGLTPDVLILPNVIELFHVAISRRREIPIVKEVVHDVGRIIQFDVIAMIDDQGAFVFDEERILAHGRNDMRLFAFIEIVKRFSERMKTVSHFVCQSVVQTPTGVGGLRKIVKRLI